MSKIKQLLEEDWERESEKDSLYLYEKDIELAWEYDEWVKEQQNAQIVNGKSRKSRKFGRKGVIKDGGIKLPRIVQHRNRRIPSIRKEWY